MSVSGYTRQSAGQIITGHTIQASDSNNEFNALQSAFDASSGHNHDGTAAAGQPIPAAGLVGLTSSSSGLVHASGANTFTASALATADIANSAITYAKIQNETNATLLGNNSGGAAAPSEISLGAGLSWITASTFGIANSAITNAMLVGSIAASKLVGTDIATVGTITSGTWNGTVVTGQFGGTGVANTGKTITLGGNFATSGAFATTLTVTAGTNVTLPITGTLATLAGSETFTNKTITSPAITGGTLNNSVIGGVTPAAATVTTLTVNSTSTLTGAVTANNFTSSGVTITGGFIDATPIGNATPDAGFFTSVIAGRGSQNDIVLNGAGVGIAPVVLFTGADANVSGIFNTKGNSSTLAFKINSATSLTVAGNSANVNTVQIAGNATGNAPSVSFQGEATVGGLIYTAGTGDLSFKTNNTNSTALVLNNVNTAVNYIQITPSAAAGGTATAAAVGSDSNISLVLNAKGTGAVTTTGAKDTLNTTGSATATSNITLTDISGMSATLINGATYAIDVWGFTNSNVASGIKVGIGGTATFSSTVFTGFADNSGTFVGGSFTGSTGVVIDITATTRAATYIRGVVTASSNGTITLQFAQSVSGGVASTITATMKVTRIS